MNFDPATSTLEISIRELAADDAFHRVGFGRSQAWRRLWLGGEAHRQLLARRLEVFPGYLGEVSLSAEFAADDFRAVVSGRADGAVEAAAGSWLIEEYKTCPMTPDGRPIFPPEREEAARRQVRFYALLWETLGRGRAAPSVVLIDAASSREERRDVPYERQECLDELLSRLRGFVNDARRTEADRARRRVFAASLPFPHASIRPIQQELMDGIRSALSGGRHLLAQAPTGSGKTAAALHAALAHALDTGKRLVFLTAKTLQQILAVETVSKMNRGAFHVLQMRSKARMCANDRILCHEEHCAYAKDYPAKMSRSGVLDRLLEHHPMLDPDTVFSAAKDAVVCPFEVEVELSGRAEVFIGDYNYVFEPAAALGAFDPEGLRDVILVIDEAHNLPDRVRQIYSPALSEDRVTEIQNLAALSPGDVWSRLAHVADRLRAFLRAAAADVPEAEPRAAEVRISREELDDILFEWDAAMIAYFEWKRAIGEVSEEDPVVTLHFEIVRFGLVARLADGRDDFTAVAARDGASCRVTLVCLDPARVIGRLLNATSSAVLTSATLEPFEMLRRLCGLKSERTDTLHLAPPFPPENRRIAIVPDIRTTFAAREKSHGRLAEMLAAMSAAHAGNSLVLFPSYRYLREVSARMPAVPARVLVQREHLTELERREILDALSAPPPGGILLLAVAGGMFAEGVDYPGEKLSAVFIVSPALPQVSFERELLRRYFDDRDEPGFEYAYVLPGMTRVVQAAGRLIRSETDRGVIVLICRRFLDEPYSRYLPRDWYGDEPWELATRDPAAAIAEFFAE